MGIGFGLRVKMRSYKVVVRGTRCIRRDLHGKSFGFVLVSFITGLTEREAKERALNTALERLSQKLEADCVAPLIVADDPEEVEPGADDNKPLGFIWYPD
jgi:hypothetical protein